MTRLFTTGLEAGTVDVFDAVLNAPVASTVQKRTGAYSLRFSAASQRVRKLFVANETEIYARIAFYVETLTGYGGNWAYLCGLNDFNGHLQLCVVAHQGSHLLGCIVGDLTDPVVDSGGSLPLNAWTCLEFYLLVDNINGVITLKQDGVSLFTFNGDTRDSSVTSVRTLQVGASANGFTGYVDDIGVNNDAGAVNNSWIGRGGVYPKYMSGVGTYTDLHAQGHANPWDCISEVPPDDADYVYDDTVNQKSTYAGSVLTPTTGTIDCINVIMRAQLDAAGTGNIARLIRSNGVDSQGADVGLDTSPKTIQEIIETDPGEAPGTPWDIDAVNALQAGAVVR